MHRPPRQLGLTCAIALLLFSTQAAAAPMTLEDFESALPANVGDVSLDTGAVGVGPLQGTSQGLLTTDLSNGAVAEAVVGNAFENGIFATDVPDNLPSKIWKQHLDKTGLSGASGVGEGSALQITFTAEAGEHLQFDVDFLTNDVSRDPYLYTDFAWYELNPPTGSKQSGVIAHTNQGGFSTFSGPDYEDHTGVQTFSLDLVRTGTHTLTLGINDVEDSFRNSALVIDWIRLIENPEPGTFGLVAVGLIGLHWQARRPRSGRP
ncbi:MAG: PEP-CTERM sorting domain-containing protein [Deltaproteobacteria bacterium]|nr:PEP-CTERM sorting domain-containing protein [Deltaproteobacteria bacterium]MBW2362938.1 PEP-CTERM sorting domain-containing protein [Deltaproteobacteria bacterium]